MHFVMVAIQYTKRFQCRSSITQYIIISFRCADEPRAVLKTDDALECTYAAIRLMKNRSRSSTSVPCKSLQRRCIAFMQLCTQWPAATRPGRGLRQRPIIIYMAAAYSDNATTRTADYRRRCRCGTGVRSAPRNPQPLTVGTGVSRLADTQLVPRYRYCIIVVINGTLL